MDTEGETDGYGQHITPLTTTQLWSKRQTTFSWTIKQTTWLDANFDTDQTAMIIPYQILSFWTGYWIDGNDNNMTVTYANKLAEISTGIEFLHGEIDIDVYTICRQRLLQQGSTNVNTYDFETSQNLLVGTYTRTQEVFTYKTVKELNPTKLRHKDQIEKDIITAKIEEIPQRHKWHREIPFEKLDHNKIYKIPDFKAENITIPGPTDVTIKNNHIKDNHELYNDVEEQNERRTEINLFRRLYSRPMICIGQPRVPDETGMMKFRYQIKLTTQLHVLFHAKPDYLQTNSDKVLWNRNTVHLPTIDINEQKEYKYACMPYDNKY